MTPDEIQELRTRFRWSQSALAARLGTDHVTVSRWERGVSRPRPSAVHRMRELSEFSPDEELTRLLAVVGLETATSTLKRVELTRMRPTSCLPLPDLKARLREVDAAVRAQTELKEKLIE